MALKAPKNHVTWASRSDISVAVNKFRLLVDRTIILCHFQPKKVIFYVENTFKNHEKLGLFGLFCFYKKKQENSAVEKVIFYVGDSSNLGEFLSNSRDFSLKKLDFLENHAILKPIFQLKFIFFPKSGQKKGKIQLKICNILRGKKQPKVINYVEEGIFNVEFGLF